jgi:hypothetical protein
MSRLRLVPQSAPEVSSQTNTPLTRQVSQRLLYDGRAAADQLSISVRSLDYLIAKRLLGTRRIGSKVLIPYSDLVSFAKRDHSEPVKTPATPKAA